MHVLATAGHVDHGKSTLVRALTGMEPDRWAEERRRGMTIDLGFAWTALPSGETVAFVDVPGHERFVPNMLAGLGPVPAVLLVVAADEGWMPQSAEHLDAIDALGVRHGLLAVTRSDLARPGPAAEQALAEVARTSLGCVEWVAVSAVTGDGLPQLRAALDRLVAALPAPDRTAPVRLWVDRSFSIRGSGTVVTGTLSGGVLRVGDELELGDAGRLVRVRALQSLGQPLDEVAATARVAVNLRGVDRADVHRGDALLAPGAYRATELVDVRLERGTAEALPARLVLHIGSAAVPVRVRPLGQRLARLRLDRSLPLRFGDRALLRDPGRHAVLAGVTALDVAAPVLARRGAAAARARVLETLGSTPDERDELRRRRIVRAADLRRMGVPVTSAPVVADWLVDPEHWAALREQLPAVVDDWLARHPLEAGVPLEVVRQALELPDRALAAALVAPPLAVREGRVGRAADRSALPPAVEKAVAELAADLCAAPFEAPTAARLAELGLGPRELAAAVRSGRLLRIAEGVVLLPDAPDQAVDRLATITQPFTLSEARQALATSRRVAVPLLELLDRRGATVRLPDDRRRVAGVVASPPAE